MDIFEILKSMLGCMYISDLKFGPYKYKALDLLKKLNFDGNQVAMAHHYITGGN